MLRPNASANKTKAGKHRKSCKKAVPAANQYKQQTYNFKKTTNDKDSFSQAADLSDSGG